MTVLTDALIVVDDVDVSGDSNTVALNFSRADLDGTTFGAAGKIHRAGMLDWTAEAGGFWTPNTDQVTPLGQRTIRPVTIAMGRTPGSPAWIATASILAGSWGGPIDTLSAWSVQMAARGGKRGRVAYYGPTAAPVSSPGFELGALDAGESLTATVHLIGPGDNVEVEVQSSPTNGWSAPDVADTVVLTATGTTPIKIGGPQPNTWWRVAVTDVPAPTNLLITLHRS